MPVTEQHGFEAMRIRLRELGSKVGLSPTLPATDPVTNGGAAIDKVFGPEGSLEQMRRLVNDLEVRLNRLPFGAALSSPGAFGMARGLRRILRGVLGSRAGTGSPSS